MPPNAVRNKFRLNDDPFLKNVLVLLSQVHLKIVWLDDQVPQKYLRDLSCFKCLNHGRQDGQVLKLSIQEHYIRINQAFCVLGKSHILCEAPAHFLSGRLLFLSLLWTDSLYLLFIAFSGWFQLADRITEWFSSSSLETDDAGSNPKSSLIFACHLRQVIWHCVPQFPYLWNGGDWWYLPHRLF